MLITNYAPGNQFFQLIGDARDCIRLVMPALDASVASEIMDTKQETTRLELVTSYALEDFFRYQSHFEAIKTFVRFDNKVHGVAGLQGSFCLFDNRYAMVNSGPMTRDGFGASKAYGVLVRDPQGIHSMLDDYQNLLAKTNSQIITPQRLKEIELCIQNLKGGTEDEAWDIERIKGELKENGWTWKVFDCLTRISETDFSLDDAYQFEAYLAAEFPRNNNVKAKIRQQLQVLRDKGFLQFVSSGRYRKINGLKRL